MMTLRITTLSIKNLTLSKMIHSIKTLVKMTLSITTLNKMALSVNKFSKKTLCIVTLCIMSHSTMAVGKIH